MTKPRPRSFEGHLKQYDIDLSLLRKWQPILVQMGYTQQQYYQIIAQSNKDLTLRTLEEQHDTLINRLKFTHEDITRLFKHRVSGYMIREIPNYYPRLCELGLSKEQFIMIIKVSGGIKSLKTVLANYAELNRLGFTRDEIALMAAYEGSSMTIPMVVEHFQCLLKHYSTPERIASGLSQKCAHQVISSLLTEKPSDQLKLIDPRITIATKRLERDWCEKYGNTPPERFRPTLDNKTDGSGLMTSDASTAVPAKTLPVASDERFLSWDDASSTEPLSVLPDEPLLSWDDLLDESMHDMTSGSSAVAGTTPLPADEEKGALPSTWSDHKNRNSPSFFGLNPVIEEEVEVVVSIAFRC